MNIGVSLSPAFLCGRASSAHQQNMLSGGVQSFLRRLCDAGATHIELRAVRPGTPGEEIAAAAEAVLNAGFSMTVHGVLADEAAETFWERLRPLLSRQSNLCVTVHSASSREQTVALLRRMAEYAALYHPGARLALENNRSKKGDNIDLVECAGVYATVREAGLSNIGTCWDFGHFCWDHMTHPALLPDSLPPAAFIERAIHTHIHSVFENTTHFPLTMGFLPLAEYIGALQKAGYSGVYNLEPEPERWADTVDAAGEIVRSVKILNTALQATGGTRQ